jgi:SAM-dependent methyltransferase
MSSEERARWNRRYGAGTQVAAAPSSLLLEWDELLPRSGRALELAGGPGHNALWLAARGLEVTLVDISTRALELARAEAVARNLSIQTCSMDLEVTPPPASAAADGRYQLVVCRYYLQRALFPVMIEALAPGGRLLFAQPTVTNLERNSSPSRRFLLERGELRRLVSGLELVRYDEGWSAAGVHEARVLAGKPDAAAG